MTILDFINKNHAASLTDSRGRVTGKLQSMINRLSRAAQKSTSQRIRFQEIVARVGGKLHMPFELPRCRTPYWLKEPHPLKGFQSNSALPTRADFVIIGAGLTGASAAYHIAQPARKKRLTVVVLEAGDPCTQASGRNGGNIETLGEQFWGAYGTYDGLVAERYKFLKEAYPQISKPVLERQANRIGEALTRFAITNARRIRATVEREGIECGLSLSGWMRSAMNEREERGLEAQARLAKALGADIHMLAASEIRRRFHLPTKYKGHIIYGNGNYNPFQLVCGELKKAIECGVELHTQTKVRKIRSAAMNKQIIETDRGTITAKRVVVATNAFTSELFPQLKDIKYFRSQVLTLEHVPNYLRGISYTAKDGDIYANFPRNGQYHDSQGKKRGTLLVGGGRDTLAKNPWNPIPSRKVFSMLLREIGQLFPQARNQPPSRYWAGPMAFVEGKHGMRMPVLGPLGDGARSGIFITVFCNGYGGGGCHNAGAGAAQWALTGEIPKDMPQDVFSPKRLVSDEPQFIL